MTTWTTNNAYSLLYGLVLGLQTRRCYFTGSYELGPRDWVLDNVVWTEVISVPSRPSYQSSLLPDLFMTSLKVRYKPELLSAWVSRRSRAPPKPAFTEGKPYDKEEGEPEYTGQVFRPWCRTGLSPRKERGEEGREESWVAGVSHGGTALWRSRAGDGGAPKQRLLPLPQRNPALGRNIPPLAPHCPQSLTKSNPEMEERGERAQQIQHSESQRHSSWRSSANIFLVSGCLLKGDLSSIPPKPPQSLNK